MKATNSFHPTIVMENAKTAIFAMKILITMTPCPFVNIARMARKIVPYSVKKEKLPVLIVRRFANPISK